MNLALLIGVDKYDRLPMLPACANDLVVMHDILKATNKYQEIQLIGSACAADTKEKIRDFFSRFSSASNIDEIFIYFSGHGGYQDDALFCCSDFDEKRAATTSISNTELDDLLRSANPKVAVKVIDACQSGAPYIKDTGSGFVKSIKASKLSSFICMASSQHDQNSYASSNSSFFTDAWANAALSRSSGTILYRDIQAALADAFASIPGQTPFFVNQGSGLEAFSLITEEMSSLCAVRNSNFSALTTGKSIDEILKLEIEKSDSRFVEYEEAVAAIETSIDLLKNKQISDTLVGSFYKKTVNSELKLTNLPRTRSFAEFGDNQGWAKKYFIDIQKETYTATVSNPMSLLGFGGNGKEYTVEKTRPAYVISTEALPVEAVEISLDANNPSLPSYRTYIGIIHSHTEVMVLSATASLTQKSWSTKALELSEIKWEYHSVPWKTIIHNPSYIWERGVSHAIDAIRSNLESIAKKATDE